jgi:hypothetical protein
MPDDSLPTDPVTPSRESWIAMHQIFTEMRSAGFTLMEAAAVLATLLKDVGKPEES